MLDLENRVRSRDHKGSELKTQFNLWWDRSRELDTNLTDVYLCEELRDCFWKKVYPPTLIIDQLGNSQSMVWFLPRRLWPSEQNHVMAKQSCHLLPRVVDRALLETSGWNGPMCTSLNTSRQVWKTVQGCRAMWPRHRNSGVIHASPNIGRDGVLLLHWSTFAIMSLWLLYVFWFPLLLSLIHIF